MLRLCSLYTLFKLDFLSLTKLHEATFKTFFQGLSAPLIEDHANKFLSEKLNQFLYSPVYSKLQEAKKSDCYTIILSSSPHFLVERIASMLGVDAWNSTFYERNSENCYSHISQVMEGKQKAHTLRQLMLDLHIHKDNVWVFTDSYQDLPLLLEAGNPIAVNPDRRLKILCGQHHWSIIKG